MTEQDRIRATYADYEHGRAGLWDGANPGYARLVRDRDRAIADLLARSIPTPESGVLDLGCGDGRLGASILRVSPTVRYVGIDLLPDRIEEARRLVPSGEFEVGSVDRLPYPDGQFDVAVAMTLFSSLPSIRMEEAAGREVARVIRPGGWLVWFDLRYDNPWNRAVHGVTRKRLRALFPSFEQTELRSCTLLPPIARRLGRTTPIAYPILEAIPPLRSHVIGRLRCPS